MTSIELNSRRAVRVFLPTPSAFEQRKTAAPNTLLCPYPNPLEENQHILPGKGIIWEHEPPFPLRTRCLHCVAQVAGLVGPPVGEPQTVLAKVVAHNEYQECWYLYAACMFSWGTMETRQGEIRLTLMYADTNFRTLNGSIKAATPLKRIKMIKPTRP